MFSQCKQTAWVSRKYTKGKYHENKDKLVAKTHKTNTIDISHPGPLNTPGSSIDLKPQKITLTETDKPKEEALALGQTEVKVKRVKTSSFLSPENKQYLMLMRANLKEGIMKAFTFKKIKKASGDGAPDGLLTGLSIGAFVSGVGSLILAFVAIFATLIAQYISPYFFVAIALGVVGITLGIVTLAMGHGDLDGMQKAFSTLGIALGGAGLLIAVIWYLILSFILSIK